MTPAAGYTEMKDSGVHWMGEIPKHWVIQRAKFHFSQTNNRGNILPTLLAASQKYGVCPQSWLEGVVQVSENTDLQQFKTVHKNDFVISLRSFQGGFERSDFEGVCSPAYQVFHADASFDNDFLKYLFKNELFIDEMNSLTVGIREGRNIKYDDFANSLIFVPPLDEQTAIAAYLDTQCAKIDEIIAEAKVSIEDYRKWKASIIYEAVTKGLAPDAEMKTSGIEWVGEIPKHWDIFPAGGVFSEVKEKNVDNEYNNPFSFRYGEIVDKRVVGEIDENMEETLSAYRVVSPNTIMLNGLNLNYDFVSQRVAIVKRKGIITSAYLAIQPDEKLIYPPFALYLLKAYDFRQVLHGIGSGIRKTLKYSDFKNIKIIAPEMKAQKIIAAYLDTQCAKIDELSTEKQSLIVDLEAYKKSLIYEAVTGKRRVCRDDPYPHDGANHRRRNDYAR